MQIPKSPRDEDQVDEKLLTDLEHKILVGIFGIIMVRN